METLFHQNLYPLAIYLVVLCKYTNCNSVIICNWLPFYIKVFFNRLSNIEKSNDNNLWNDQNEKKDFFIFFNLTVIFVYLIMSKAVLYNGWRQVYFLNVFIIYFTSYGIISLVENISFVKKFSKYFYTLIVFSLILIFYSIYKYHPYQSLYFNNFSKIMHKQNLK